MDNVYGIIEGKYSDGDKWRATLGVDGNWSCDDAAIASYLQAGFSPRADPLRLSHGPIDVRLQYIHAAAKDTGAEIVQAPNNEMPEGAVS